MQMHLSGTRKATIAYITLLPMATDSVWNWWAVLSWFVLSHTNTHTPKPENAGLNLNKCALTASFSPHGNPPGKIFCGKLLNCFPLQHVGLLVPFLPILISELANNWFFPALTWTRNFRPCCGHSLYFEDNLDVSNKLSIYLQSHT